MDFTGSLNYPNPTTLGNLPKSEVAAYMRTRMELPTPITDARRDRGVLDNPEDSTELLLNGEGFLLARVPSAVKDWEDPKDVAAHCYGEYGALLKRLLPGATVPLPNSHTFRKEEYKEHFWVDGIQYGPCAAAVHNDYADFVSDDNRTVVQKFTEVQGMPLDRRTIGINIWRSVTATPLERFPLAVCDRTSVELDDLEYDINENAKPRPFNAHYCKPNPNQRWYYYSEMAQDEALVFTTYDSHPSDGFAFRPTLHTAVQLPDSEGRQPRVSVEVRFFVTLPIV